MKRVEVLRQKLLRPQTAKHLSQRGVKKWRNESSSEDEIEARSEGDLLCGQSTA
jgi:hypothetical protein